MGDTSTHINLEEDVKETVGHACRGKGRHVQNALGLVGLFFNLSERALERRQAGFPQPYGNRPEELAGAMHLKLGYFRWHLFQSIAVGVGRFAIWSDADLHRDLGKRIREDVNLLRRIWGVDFADERDACRLTSRIEQRNRLREGIDVNVIRPWRLVRELRLH